MRIFNWKARRVGDAITVIGKDSGGAAVKVAGITKIEPRANRIFATDRHGNEHEMVLA